VRPESFTKTAPGQVVQAETEGKSYWAFVPDPLPPRIEVDWELAALIADATGALRELNGYGRRMRNPSLLIVPFLQREAVLSSRIEGTQAGIADLYAREGEQLALPGLAPRPVSPDVREVSNYVRALQEGLRRLPELPVSWRLIRELHGVLLEGVRGRNRHPGQFRQTPNYIAPSDTVPIHEARFVPPPVPQMRQALNELEIYLHAQDQYPALVRLALVHYQFETIHPFEDGNGRLGRLLVSLLLIDWGLLSLPLLYLSAYLEKHRDEYYDLLYRVSTAGAWNDWLRFFLLGVREQADAAMRLSGALIDVEESWHSRLAGARASALAQRLADGLFALPVLSVNNAAGLLETSYQTARYNVNKLLELGILREAAPGTREQIYVATDILNLMVEPTADDGRGTH